jgi:predicted RNA-binding Zn ribbon-like protein
VQRLVDFANTFDPERGGEHLTGAWLGAPDATAEELALARALRDAIRALAFANAGLPHDDGAEAVIDGVARRAGLTPVLEAGMSRLEPRAEGVDAALGRIVAELHAAIWAGTFERLKACERESCRAVFHDHSRNHSGRWCSMAICGAREKSARAYRRRLASGG